MARKQDLEKYKRILNSSFSVFGEMGYKDAGIKEIARRAQVAAGSIYTYFNDKETLFRATMIEAGKYFLKEISAAAAKKNTAEEKLKTILDIGFSKIRSIHPLIRGLFNHQSILDLITGNMDLICRRIVLVLWVANDTASEHEMNLQTNLLKTLFFGILFMIAVTDYKNLGPEMEKIKSGILHRFSVRQPIPV